MSPRLSLLMAFGLIVAVLTVPLWWGRPAEAAWPSPTQAAPPEGDRGAPIAMRGPEVFSTELTPEHLLLPTGEMVPVLNDALGAPPLEWADDRPWSPIVGTVTDPDGKEWYVHEDGTRTITQIVIDEGTPVPETNVAYPTADMPLEGPDKEDGRD